MTFLFTLLLRSGVPLKLARPLAYAIAIIGAALVVWGAWTLWLHFHDKGVVEADRAAQTIEVLKGDVKANDKAAETRRADDSRLTAEAHELEKVTTNATDPADARRRYYDCVRIQQDARARGIPSPSC